MLQLSESEWKKKLTPAQFDVLRKKGTEPPFSGDLLKNTKTGDYTCAACGNVLFKSSAKFESKTPGLEGWPSFSAPAKDEVVELKPDDELGMERTEVVCTGCGGHLGHVFDANDSSTGKHYCINSCVLNFKER